MREPSGENRPKLSNFSCVVTLWIAPDSLSRICSEVWSASPNCGCSWRVNSSDLPSADQLIGEAGELGGALFAKLQVPDVRRRAFPPSAETIQRCEGVSGPVAR